MAFANPSAPNLADFAVFCYAQGVPEGDLPSGSDYLQWAFDIAMGIALIPPADMLPILYVLAVYNLGMHQLLKIAQDQSGQTFFAQQRTAFKLLTFQAGPVGASADQSTSNTLVAADFIKGLTMQGLDLLNTPWGREYLAYAQMAGPNAFGVS